MSRFHDEVAAHAKSLRDLSADAGNISRRLDTALATFRANEGTSKGDRNAAATALRDEFLAAEALYPGLIRQVPLIVAAS